MTCPYDSLSSTDKEAASPSPSPPTTAASISDPTSTTSLPASATRISSPTNPSPPHGVTLHSPRVPVDSIFEPTPYNGRAAIDHDNIRTLANSIATSGLLNPITIRPHGDRYQLVAGGNRLAAYRLLGRDTIPACIIHANDNQAALARLAENANRSNLSPVEEATQLAKLVDDNAAGVDGVAHAIGRKPNWILDRLDVLSWPDDLVGHVHTRKISLATAKRLARIPDPALQVHLVQQAAEHGCSARTAALWLQDAQITTPTEADMSQKMDQCPPQEVKTTTQISCFVCRKPTDLARTKTVWICDPCIIELGTPPPNVQPQQPPLPHQYENMPAPINHATTNASQPHAR